MAADGEAEWDILRAMVRTMIRELTQEEATQSPIRIRSRVFPRLMSSANRAT